jgi:hypothetical protein
MQLLLLTSTEKGFIFKFSNLIQCHKHPKFKRPCFGKTIVTDAWYRYLQDEMHEWLVSMGIEYTLIFIEIGVVTYWYIDIPDDSAVLFKLTWM